MLARAWHAFARFSPAVRAAVSWIVAEIVGVGMLVVHFRTPPTAVEYNSLFGGPSELVAMRVVYLVTVLLVWPIVLVRFVESRIRLTRP